MEAGVDADAADVVSDPVAVVDRPVAEAGPFDDGKTCGKGGDERDDADGNALKGMLLDAACTGSDVAPAESVKDEVDDD
jgi:hypothetical protein